MKIIDLWGFKLIPRGGGRVIGMHMVTATAALLPTVVSLKSWDTPGVWDLTGALFGYNILSCSTIFAARNMTSAAARKVFQLTLVSSDTLGPNVV
ncbi:MAG: hypothetical protein CM1200mP14_21280 [Gammaproteobacteria bacterium]|nr:MAG: hypothetical protein CM1200mP14_21280 [Gammaproteobacteria bacterium]